jgi:hypothetical protein
MGNEPRKQHFLPVFWLKGFASTGKADGKLHALDSTGKVYTTVPRDAGCQRDYYRFNRTDGGDEFVVEKHIDSMGFDTLLDNLVVNRHVPTGTEFDQLLAFTALMAARVPAARGAMENLVEAFKQVRRAAEWEAETGMRCPGLGPAPGATVFPVSKEDLPTELTQNDWVRSIFESADIIYGCLKRRRWTVLLSEDPLPDFICSDCPVAAVFTRPASDAFDRPGFGTCDTQVSFPLSRRAAVISGCNPENDPKPPEIAPADRKAVAKTNTKTLMYARRLYWATDDFVYEREDGHEGGVEDQVERLS